MVKQKEIGKPDGKGKCESGRLKEKRGEDTARRLEKTETVLYLSYFQASAGVADS